MNKFEKLGVIKPVLKAIEEENITEPTEIQRKAIPLVVSRDDVIAGSATGSGKTLVFGSSIIQNSERGKGIQALILTPTRELAEQVSKALLKFSKYKPLKVTAIYGGVSINPQMEKLKIADVVVGTPGRMLDHIGRKTIDLRNVKTLVLDEADTMLDMGFIDDVEKIIRACPRDRQTMLFSATITSEVSRLAQEYMKNPKEVSVDSYVDPKKLRQVYYDVPGNMKLSLLVHLLKHEEGGLVMVFCNTRQYVDFVAKNLKRSGIEATAIHGGLSQDKRNRVMSKFHSKDVYVLVCTDVAARGLDIQNVSHVYNFDIPSESKQYIHRIGRTARAGEKGKAISILGERDYENFRRVLRDSELNVDREEMPYVEKIHTVRPEGRPYERHGQRRPHGKPHGSRNHTNRRRSH
ncbi:MAG: DEAD/DEAH box helicase [Candidatus Aenigmarchaeota archaeon]|nr:DEAD/DEAH box helicase [Candidatus Aenigmarchaeota archaeon]